MDFYLLIESRDLRPNLKSKLSVYNKYDKEDEGAAHTLPISISHV